MNKEAISDWICIALMAIYGFAALWTVPLAAILGLVFIVAYFMNKKDK
jgi:hypothetical protein